MSASTNRPRVVGLSSRLRGLGISRGRPCREGRYCGKEKQTWSK